MTDDKSTGGTRHYHQPEASQAERRAMLRQDTAARTYFDLARGDPDAIDGPAVTGASAKPYGADLPGPAWSRDLAALPKERPLGENIHAVNDISAVWFDPDYAAPSAESADEA